ncbi:hypothetical protein ABKW02_24210, partial [Enterobacter cloacae]
MLNGTGTGIGNGMLSCGDIEGLQERLKNDFDLDLPIKDKLSFNHVLTWGSADDTTQYTDKSRLISLVGRALVRDLGFP